MSFGINFSDGIFPISIKKWNFLYFVYHKVHIQVKLNANKKIF